MLFALPIDLLRVVFNYLQIEEFAKLDRSLLSHSLRPLYTEALTGFEILSLEKIPCNFRLIKWLTSRRILVTSINFSEYAPSAGLPFFAANRSCLQAVKFFSTCHVDVNNDIFIPLRECSRLNTISFDSCHQISDEGVQILLEPTTEQAEDVEQVEDEASVPTPHREVLKLKTLEFNDCSLVTNQTLAHIASHCPTLNQLGLSGCDLVDNTEIEKIIQGCPLLLSLDLSKTSITDTAVLQILEAYPNLQTMTLFNCNGVSLAVKAEVLRRISLPEIQSEMHEIQLLGVRSLRKALSDGEFIFLSTQNLIIFHRIPSSNR
jgi:hypothetical protein